MTSWIKGVNIEDMLHYGLDFFTLIYEDDEPPSVCTFSPACAYIFGEHSDYNHGYAMAVTLPLTIVALVGYNNRQVINIASEATCGAKFLETFPLHDFQHTINSAQPWVKSTLWTLAAFKDKIQSGLNIAYVSCIPIGIGLGSSSAMTSTIFAAIECIVNSQYRTRPKIRICRDIELHGTDTPTGVAQPMIILCAEVGYALTMDCKTLTSTFLPTEKLPVAFILTYSGTERVHSSTKLKKRMEECKKAATYLGIRSLGDCTSDFLRVNAGRLSETLYKRVVHVIEEAIRIYNATAAFKKQDYRTFGLLMLQSHHSLKTNFEVTTEDIDDLVNIAMACPGVYGSKLSGYGFGGCTITLLKRENIEEFVKLMEANYKGECSFLVVQSWGSTSEISQEMKDYLHGDYQNKETGKEFENVGMRASTPSTPSCYLDDSSDDAVEVLKRIGTKL